VDSIIRRKASSYVSVLLILCSSILLTTISIPDTASSNTSHDPILIDGDLNLTSENGVVSGSGTPSDPFVIEGWSIVSQDEPALIIVNTSASIIVRGITLQGGGLEGHGILLKNCTNITLTESTVTGFENGIVISGSSFVSVAECNASDNAEIGVYVTGYVGASGRGYVSTDIEIADNLICRNGWSGIFFGSGGRLRAEGNMLIDNKVGINLHDVVIVELKNNHVLNNDPLREVEDGISAACSDTITIAGNTVMCVENETGRRGIGIAIALAMGGGSNMVVDSNTVAGFERGVSSSVYNARIRYNLIANNSIGLSIMPRGIEVYGNNLIDNDVQARSIDAPEETYWNASYPVGGNFWSDYSGNDELSGPAQNLPTSDGVGDTPYSIDNTTTDAYPLMTQVDIESPPQPWPESVPRATFSALPESGTVSTIFEFNASSSTDAEDESELLEIRWDWEGDGIWDTAWTNQKIVNHTFVSPGEYNVTLEVRDSSGNLGSAYKTILVLENDTLSSLGVLIIVSASVVIIVMLVAFFMVLRRRLRATP
jgi:parallel beta-helix repeat protein